MVGRSVIRERVVGSAALCLTFVFTAGTLWHVFEIVRSDVQGGRIGDAVLASCFAVIVIVLAAGSLVYQVCRFGFLARVPHRATPEPQGGRRALRNLPDEPPSVTMLIPSYKEEPQFVRQAMLSAVLQDHPRRRVVLLIDDPSRPVDAGDIAMLERTRALVAEIEALVAEPRLRAKLFDRAMSDGLARGEHADEWRNALLGELDAAAQWLELVRTREVCRTHTDRLFGARVLQRWVDELADMKDALASGHSNADELVACRRQLRALFDVEVTSFERKRWANLPHEANKAMNINAYLGLLGGEYVYTSEVDGEPILTDTGAEAPDLIVPDADYIVTLDADSILDPHYVRRLVAELELPGNERVAVIQTPYSAVPDPPTVLERAAGATTDLQYVVHQGFTRWNATFWVGANAVLRADAIRTIETSDVERGWPIRRFIQDRTVIEDTESSIDLAAAGWQLHNVPERLSWSATPPDFGALVIQRRRWANGGLIIAPKLARLRQHRRSCELWLRAHYLLSPTVSNVSVALLLLVPFGAALNTIFLPFTAAPYICLQYRDLRHLGYRRTDILRTWALNLLLVPVNLAGVAKSIRQSLSGRKTPFARTPKVDERTRVPVPFILAPVVVMITASINAAVQLGDGRLLNATFGFLTAATLGYALVAFVGLRTACDDLATHLPIPATFRNARHDDEPAERKAA